MSPDPTSHAQESAAIRVLIKDYEDSACSYLLAVETGANESVTERLKAEQDKAFAALAIALADPTPAPSGDDVAELRAERDALKERVRVLEEAVRPFALMWQKDLTKPADTPLPEHSGIEIKIVVTLGDLAKAHAALGQSIPAQGDGT